MLQLKLGAERGGDQTFNSAADAIVWLTDRAHEWESVLARHATSSESAANAPTRRLYELSEELKQAYKRNVRFDDARLDPTGVAILRSPLGQLIHNTYNNVGALAGDAILSASQIIEAPVNWQQPQAISGVVSYLLFSTRLSQFESNNVREALHNTLIQINDEWLLKQAKIEEGLDHISANKDRLAVESAKVGSFVSDMKTTIDAERNALRERVEQAADLLSATVSTIHTEIEEAKSAGTSSIENFQKAHEEKLRLESAINLWRSRSKLHKRNSLQSRTFALWFALIGFLSLFGVSALAYKGVKWLLSSEFSSRAVLTVPNSRLTNGLSELRPTFHYELIFTGVATIAWLTLVLWGLRLIVRNYTSESHLSVDASSRSALASTYFSLVRDGVASSEDRAIMLATLFRPVHDGMVKDDGLPLLSPAAALATLASGKGGGG